ncbi:MAG: hypothetical protein NUV54_00030 [Candidatus Taylorbacteria bacterium]|nr:hypothetical protein [Candidatus Taylorbacteria bacterium]
MEIQQPSIESFMEKIEKIRKEGGVDLSTAEDLSMAVMNLISLEEHFFFTGVKTKKDDYFDTSLEIREMRKKLLAELMPNHEGETWCASKHLLATTMRLVEVGNKLYSEGKKDEAKEMFERAYKVYSIFWALKVKLITVNKLQQESKNNSHFEDLVTKLADCCNE